MKQHKKGFQACNISVNQEPEVDIVDDCAVPNYKVPLKSEIPGEVSQAVLYQARIYRGCVALYPHSK